LFFMVQFYTWRNHCVKYKIIKKPNYIRYQFNGLAALPESAEVFLQVL